MGYGLLELLLDTIFDLYWNDNRIGKYGEKLTERKLKLVNMFGRKGKILKNIYIPKDNGETTEIDLVYITQKGIFVIESKNYSGWIFGDNKSIYWTSCLPNGDKNKFYNPVKQNQNHIKWLREYMKFFTSCDIPMYSIIVFSERCELKKVPEDLNDVVICQRDDLHRKIRNMWEMLPDLLIESDVDIMYSILEKLTNVSEAEKQAHIDNIWSNSIKKNACTPSCDQVIPSVTISEDSISSDVERVCPKCGSALVLRTARKGSNAGNQFYGCSAFPKCRFIQNL